MKNLKIKGKIPRTFAAGLAGFYFVVNVVVAHSAETSFWAQRRRASAERMGGISPIADALVHTDSQTVLANMPCPSAIEISGGSKPFSASADLKEPFAIGPKAGNWIGKLVSPFGTVNDSYLSPKKDAPFVVHIQDAHGIEEAQRNISSMISLLGQDPGITLVGVEGAWGPFSVDAFRDFPDPAMTKDLAEFLLKKGMIAGPEYAGLTMPNAPTFFGVESSDLYNANVQALKTAYKDQDAAKAWVDRLKATTYKLKESEYSEPLKTFDQNFLGYQFKKVKLVDYVRYLTSALMQMKGCPVPPNLQLLKEALDQEKVIDFNQVEIERRQMVEKLVNKLSPDRLQELMEKSVEYRAGRVGYGEYHTHLKRVCRFNGISIKAYPQMERYIEYVFIADKIDHHRLLNELDTVERILPHFLAKTSLEKELVSITYDLSLLHKLVRYEMSPSDWSHYQSRGDMLRTAPERLARLTPTTTAPSDPTDNISLTPFEDFCRLASERNTAFTDNLTRRMAEDKKRSGILVAGGFHTEGLTTLLREKQISYFVITPKITAIPKDNKYMDVLARDPVPLEQLLSGDRIYLASRVRLSDSESDPARIAHAAITVSQGASESPVSSTVKISRLHPKDPSTLILLLELGKKKFYLIKHGFSPKVFMGEKFLKDFKNKIAVSILAPLTFFLVPGLGLDLGMTYPWTLLLSDILLLEGSGANLTWQWMGTLTLFALWNPLTLYNAGATNTFLKTEFRPTSLLLTKERTARNHAISQHTQTISNVLYLAAGYDLTNVLTTFPLATSVTMVGLFYNKRLDVDAIRREMVNPNLKLITEDYSISVLTHGYANYWTFNDLRFELSLIALELVSLRVAPESVTPTEDGKGLRFKRAGPQGEISTEIFFVPATLGPDEHSNRWPPLRFGSTEFDGLYLKAQYPLPNSLPKIIGQVSENLAENSTLVVNENDFFRSTRKGFGGLTLHHLGGPYYSEGDDEYGNSFQIYLASRHPSSANNIFFHLLRPWMGTEMAARWGMRLLPLEIMGLGAAGWTAPQWAPAFWGGVMAGFDPVLLGMAALFMGLLIFKATHFILEVMVALAARTEPPTFPDLPALATESLALLPYAFLPLLITLPSMFFLSFIFLAVGHTMFDSRRFNNPPTETVQKQTTEELTNPDIFLKFLEFIAHLPQKDGISGPSLEISGYASWTYKDPPVVPENVASLITLMHGELMTKFPSYSSLFKRARTDFTTKLTAEDLLVFWKKNQNLMLDNAPPSPKLDFTYSLVGTNVAIPEMKQNLRISKFIGQGGFGVVFEATNSTGKKFIVKTSPPLGQDRSLDWYLIKLATLLNEGQVLKSLTPTDESEKTWVAPIFIGFGFTTRNTVALVMEFIEGVTLLEKLNDPLEPGYLSFKDATKIAVSLANVHRKGIVHRDIKSNNIIEDTRGEIRFIDFGSAFHMLDIPTNRTHVNNEISLLSLTTPPPIEMGLSTVTSRFDYYLLWVLFDDLLPFFQGLSPLLKKNPESAEEARDREVLMEIPYHRRSQEIWESRRNSFFSEIIFQNINDPARSKRTIAWLRETEKQINGFYSEYGKPSWLSGYGIEKANNIFFHLLRPWMGTEMAARWGMRLLPLEIMGLGAAGWFAQRWAQPLLNGMLALDPTIMGALFMVAGILAFRSLHLALDKIWVGKHPGLSPPENRFWSNSVRMMLYAFLPFLVASPALFALAFSVFAYDHFAYDRQQLLNKKTHFVYDIKTLEISMASATAAAVVIAPIVVANMNFPMGTFFFISFVSQTLDPAILQSFSDSPSAGLTALAIGTVSNFSTYVFSMGWATMAALGFVTSTAFSRNLRTSIKKGIASILPVLGLIQNAPAQSAPTPAPVVLNSQTNLPIQQQLVREAVLNLITGAPFLRIPDKIRAAEKFTPNMFKGIAQDDIKKAISDLEDQSATNRAAKNYGRLLGEDNGPETRITMNFLGFNNWPENLKATAQAVLAGMLGVNQPVLIVSEVSAPVEILRQAGVTHNQTVLVKTYVNADVYTTMNDVERNNNNDIPLSAIVLVQEGAKNFIGKNHKYKAQYFESIANSINKEIQALLAVLRAA